LTIWNSNIELKDNTGITSPCRRQLEEDEVCDTVRNMCFLDRVGSESKTNLILLYLCVCVCVCNPCVCVYLRAGFEHAWIGVV
jgi:hypothetical protein